MYWPNYRWIYCWITVGLFLRLGRFFKEDFVRYKMPNRLNNRMNYFLNNGASARAKFACNNLVTLKKNIMKEIYPKFAQLLHKHF